MKSRYLYYTLLLVAITFCIGLFLYVTSIKPQAIFTKSISNVSEKNTEEKYVSLATEYAGEHITSSTTLASLLKIDNDGNPYHDTKFVAAYRYGNLIYASFSTGESGWYSVFYEEADGVFTMVARGQDIPLCKSFEGFKVQKGLWCRMGGCFEQNKSVPINTFDDCLSE
jgi:hypothetical protein